MIHIRTNELLYIIVESEPHCVTDEFRERCAALIDSDVSVMIVGVRRLTEMVIGQGNFANIMATALVIALEEMEFAMENVIQLDVSAND